ncbi:MAG TPA: DUF2281 domain-containing protein [Longimicrobiales bacterium]
MHDVMRKRLWRKLEALPDERLYQVLDFIEFLESKYAPGRAPEPDRLQRFAERVEDGMRARAVAPRIMRRTVGWLGTAGRVVDGFTSAGRKLLRELDAVARPTDGAGAAASSGGGPAARRATVPAAPALESTPRPEPRE